MNKPADIRNWLLCTAIALITLATATYAEDCPADIKAVTATDVKVPIEVLSYRAKPLTKCELQAEAEEYTRYNQSRVRHQGGSHRCQRNLDISGWLLSIVAGKAAQRAASRSKSFSALLRDFLVISVRRLVLFIGFFVGLSALEISVGPVLALIGAAGFVIAFALQNSLSNFASGILMLIYRPFDTDDTIKVASILGKVESMNLLSTQLRTPDNQLVIVPQ